MPVEFVRQQAFSRRSSPIKPSGLISRFFESRRAIIRPVLLSLVTRRAFIVDLTFPLKIISRDSSLPSFSPGFAFDRFKYWFFFSRRAIYNHFNWLTSWLFLFFFVSFLLNTFRQLSTWIYSRYFDLLCVNKLFYTKLYYYINVCMYI